MARTVNGVGLRVLAGFLSSYAEPHQAGHRPVHRERPQAAEKAASQLQSVSPKGHEERSTSYSAIGIIVSAYVPLLPAEVPYCEVVHLGCRRHPDYLRPIRRSFAVFPMVILGPALRQVRKVPNSLRAASRARRSFDISGLLAPRKLK